MQKWSSFEIKSIEMQGFVHFKDMVSFSFGNITLISGDNGQGKSTIANAICFALLGTTYFGEKTLDKLHNPQSPEMMVSLELIDDTGEIHKLTRIHNSSGTNIVFDGVSIHQKNLEELLGERDLLLSMFNPLYFIETLGTGGQELLERYLPFVKHEAVLAELPEQVRTEMAGEQFLTPQTYLKNKRAKVKELENTLFYYRGQRDAEMLGTDSAIKRLTAEIDAINEQIASVEAASSESGLSVEDNSPLARLKHELDEIGSENATLDEHLMGDIEALEEKMKVLSSAQYVPVRAKEIEAKSQELKDLYQRFDEIRASIANTQPGYRCPTCHHEMTAEDANNARNELNNRLAACVADGKKVKTELDELNRYEQECKAIYVRAVAEETAAFENMLSNVKAKYRQAAKSSGQNCAKAIEGVRSNIQSYENRNGVGAAHDIQALYAKRDILTAELQVHQNVLNNPTYAKAIEDTQNQIAALKLKISNVILYIGKKNELLFKNLKMNRVSVVLNEVAKTTGEIKDVFKFAYNSRDYKRISLSEKVRAGLEVTELLKRLSGRNYPTFIDNYESLSVIDNVRPTSQLFFARVEKGKPLTVKPAGKASNTQHEGLRKAG